MAEEVGGITQLVLSLILLGILLGVGVLLLGKFGTTVYDLTTVTDETVTLTAGAGALSHVDVGISSVTSPMVNSSNASVEYVVTAANWTAATGVLSFDPNLINGTYNLTYIYKKNTTTTDSMNDVIDSLTPIASDWMPLIVTITVLAVILLLVMRSFAIQR